MARRLPDRYPLKPAVHGAIITTGGLSLWLFLSRWVLTAIPVDVIDRFLDDPSDDPLLLCKAIDLDWNTAAAVLAARLDLPQLREGYAEEINRKYRKLTTSSARRVLRFWQAREKLAAAG